MQNANRKNTIVQRKIRRAEHSENSRAEIEKLLAEASFGFLGLTTGEPYPYIVPVNFVWHDEAVWFHGSRLGQKMAELRTNAAVTFCVADEVALVPSYFTSDKLACPATAFFRSVMIFGKAEIVEDAEIKIEALSAFMKKLQSEGGYAPFSLEDDEYRRNVKSVAVIRIAVEQMSAKFKFGQNRSESDWRKTRAGLLQRNQPRDAEAVQEMEKRCPFQLSEPHNTGESS